MIQKKGDRAKLRFIPTLYQSDQMCIASDKADGPQRKQSLALAL